MAAELPVVTIVLFIASGTLLFMLLFLFAKRQIMRYALKSSHKPHIAIGYDAVKNMRDEIRRRLAMIQKVRYEPTLLTEHIHSSALIETNHYFYRMKAMDAFTNAGAYVTVNFCRSRDKSIPLRQCEQTMQLYLLNICSFAADSQQAHVIDEFCILYNNARHGPSIFSKAEYIHYMELLNSVIQMINTSSKSRSVIQEEKIDTEVRLGTLSDRKVSTETVIHYPSTRWRKQLASTFRSGRLRQQELISLVDRSAGYDSAVYCRSGNDSDERLSDPYMSGTPYDMTSLV